MRLASDFWVAKTTWLVFLALALDGAALAQGHAAPKEAVVGALVALAALCLRDTVARRLELIGLDIERATHAIEGELREIRHEEMANDTALVLDALALVIRNTEGAGKALEVSKAVMGGAERLLDEAAAVRVKSYLPRD